MGDFLNVNHAALACWWVAYVMAMFALPKRYGRVLTMAIVLTIALGWATVSFWGLRDYVSPFQVLSQTQLVSLLAMAGAFFAWRQLPSADGKTYLGGSLPALHALLWRFLLANLWQCLALLIVYALLQTAYLATLAPFVSPIMLQLLLAEPAYWILGQVLLTLIATLHARWSAYPHRLTWAHMHGQFWVAVLWFLAYVWQELAYLRTLL